MILPHMDGVKSVDTILTEVGKGLRRNDLEMLVAQLDHAGLLEGPSFDAILSRVRREFESLPYLPPASTANVADALASQDLGEDASKEQIAEQGPAKLREALDRWMKETLDPAPKPSFLSTSTNARSISESPSGDWNPLSQATTPVPNPK